MNRILKTFLGKIPNFFQNKTNIRTLSASPPRGQHKIDVAKFTKEISKQTPQLPRSDIDKIVRVLIPIKENPEEYMKWKYSIEVKPTPSKYDVALTDISENTLKEVDNFLPLHGKLYFFNLFVTGTHFLYDAITTEINISFDIILYRFII